jgi:hypothetical protein
MDTNMVPNSLGRSRSSVEEGAEATLRLIADPDESARLAGVA